jgi:hypothetical protein
MTAGREGAEREPITPPDSHTREGSELRFQVLLNEPMATPDRRSVVAGTTALVVKDRRSGQCYVAVTIGQAGAMAPAPCGE